METGQILKIYKNDKMSEIYISDEEEKKKLYDGFKHVVELVFEENDEDFNFGDILYENYMDDPVIKIHCHCFNCNLVFFPELLETAFYNIIASVYGEQLDEVNQEGLHVVVDLNENLLKVNEIDKLYITYLKIVNMYGLNSSFNILTSEQTPIHEKHETINFHLDELNLSGKKKKKKDKKKKKKNK